MTAKPPLTESGSSSLQRTLLRGSVLEMVGYGVSQVLRLASNLILTRLLFPHAFGLSQQILIVLYALGMLSDMGVRQCVIQHPQGESPAFLDTAFTVHAIRGGFIAAATCLLAWPVGIYGFREPQLVPLLLFAAVMPVIQGFSSMALFVLRRRVQLGPVIVLEIASQVVATSVTVGWAYLYPSAWALVGGMITQTVVSTAATFVLPGRIRHRFRLDPEALASLKGFGRWIMASSALTFFGSRADTILFARFLGTAALGVYAQAVMLAEAMGTVLERITGGVIYPLFSRAARDHSGELDQLYYRIRLRLDALALPALGLLCGCGNLLVEVLWDERYAEAGWMLRWLCLRSATVCLAAPCESCLTGSGLPRYGFYKNLARTITVVVGLPLGFSVGGTKGLVIATALSELPGLLVLWRKFAQLGLLRLTLEARAIGFFLAGLGAGLGISRIFPHVPWR